ncbi:hypothetical protein YB2330_000840 [Saitoella coloradoensis]|uniref:Uncharacterized protein n=1 Tax=Saitoella complicata (strain BCRC 22490 / CBS 7301 / JCM 7358 / NBRC 10748 / NRRL Y-17804) TaxID=698492 RepID=A0A0E9NRC0_SAICN|nr:DUF1761-domain-containing protein [Saitoella complicata NRRL Y-17804]ODQ54282.1 DUF1761-domain-containing protein [Saitoella complicata NRRL Y-17804]GAO52236.1 hypothetical protein G7K_6318-t1 [Saitoella complicata NRRL Y-17804]
MESSRLPLSHNLNYFPAVKPSALILGTLFEHVSSFIVYGPLFGQTWQKAMSTDKNSEFWASKETKSALTIYSSSLVSSITQTYAIAALINLSGTVTYKGAAQLGALIFMAQTIPQVVMSVVQEKRPRELTLTRVVTGLVQTVGMSLVLVGYGTRRALVGSD